MKKRIYNSIVIIGLTFFIPGIIAILTRDSYKLYYALVRPKFAPPSFIFPIVWNIIYLLISIGVILVKNNDEDNIKIYFIQLLLNALWSPIFFVLKNYLLALFELLILLLVVIYMSYKFYKDNKKTIYFNLPYILWLLYALYLNYYVFLYN